MNRPPRKTKMPRFLIVLGIAVVQTTAFASTTAGTLVLPDPDPLQDREPAVIVQRTSGGTDRVITAWIKRTADSLGQLRVAAIDASDLGGNWQKPTLPCPFFSCSSTDTSGDPYLAENPYTSGIFPKRVYLAGVSGRASGENQITIWSSDDAGASWSTQAALSHSFDLTWAADKPSISVSWEPSTAGQTYVAHLLINEQNPACWDGQRFVQCNSRIVVSRLDSTTGQFHEVEVLDGGGTAVSSPIVVTHTANRGWVFLVWLNWQTNRIKVAFSTDYGDTFPIVRETSAGTLLGIGTDSLSNAFGATVYARSMLMARFNSISGTLGIVWHAREPNSTSASDIKFISWNPWTYAFGTRWTVTDSQSISTPDAPTPGNQWNPALDYDSNGDYLVTYYDTRQTTQDAGEFNYVVRAAHISSDGLRIPEADTQVTPQQSNLLLYDIPRNGEYQDVWNWNGSWYAAFIQISSFGDVAVSRITDSVPRDAQVLSQNVPTTMTALQSYTVSATLKNTGTQTWSPVGPSPQCNVFRLGSTNPQDNLTWGRMRADLPTAVAPGEQVTINFDITAPSTPGTYNFQWRMLQECVTWFGDSTPNVPVTVVPPPPPVANFSFACTGLSCSFNGTGSAGTGITYAWSFGDSTNGTGSTASHQYGVTGAYTVTLTVTDPWGQQSSKSKKVSVISDEPLPAENYFTVAPCRLIDTRNTTPLNMSQLHVFNVAPGCGVPATAKAVAVNVGVISATSPGHLIFYPGNMSSGPFVHSTINSLADPTPRFNNAILQLATNGTGTLALWGNYTGQFHFILDIYGYFSEDSVPAPGAQGPFGFQTVTACRLVDTRISASPLAHGIPQNFTVQGNCGVPAGAAAAMLNPVSVTPSEAGYIELFQAGTPVPFMATLRFPAGIFAQANGARTRLSASTPDLTVQFTGAGSQTGTSHFVLDVYGYFKSDAPLKYRPVTPCRLVDTREADRGAPILAAGETRTFQVQGNCGIPVGAKAAMLNVVSTGSIANGRFEAFPSGTTQPGVSLLNFNPSLGNLANGAIVSLSTNANDLAIFTSNGTHLVIDVFGYFQ